MLSVHVNVVIQKPIVVVIPDEPIPTVKGNQDYSLPLAMRRPGMLTAWVSVSTKLVGLKVAQWDGVHELVVVLSVGGIGPARAGVAEV